MKKIIKAPRGTQDILGAESYRWQFLEKTALEVAATYGFFEQRTPTFEAMDLFKRSVGDTTDVVQKEMYQVRPEKGDDLFGLKPEGTAGAVRAAIENGLLKEALPLKICYITPCFRHERPQAGRLREFHQFGVELFGSASPAADAEVIGLAKSFLQMLGLSGVELQLNSIGCPDCRPHYYQALVDYYTAHRDTLCPTCLERLEKNPMRLLDCKNPACAALSKDAPVVLDYLCDPCQTHFDGVRTRLDVANIDYTVNAGIVRGLDYYTRTVFEFVSGDLGAQSTVCGGGRYDGLVEQLGGPATPALGFGSGLERLLMVMAAQGIEPPTPRSCEIYIASMGDAANVKAYQLVQQLRTEGFYAECDSVGRSLKAQMKYANKIGARLSMVLGDSELESGQANLKRMDDGSQRLIQFEKDLVSALYDFTLEEMSEELGAQLEDSPMSSLFGLGDNRI